MRFFTAILSGFLITTTVAHAQSVPTITFTPVITSGLSQPLDIVRPPQDSTRLFIVEKGGRVKILENGTTLRADSFLKISSLIATSGEQGLLSLVFHPQYATNRFFWVLYNNTSGDIVLARYQTLASNPNVADASSGVVVKVVPHPTNNNHNGGKLIFGPADGFLYWSTGDGGGGGDLSNNAQTKSVLLGKMLRLNVNTSATPPYFTAPSSNPFVGQAGADSLVYQFGLRNPFRWSFDRLNGDMWIADVGQGAWEEVNYSPAGTHAARDWGWRCREGAHVYSTTTTCPPGYSDPVYEYNHDTASGGGLSITGGYVYRGTDFPALYGRYVCADFVCDHVYTVAPTGTGSFVGTYQNFAPKLIAAFGEDHRGELYAARLNGTIYRIGAQGGTPLSVPGSVKETSISVSPVPVVAGAPLILRNAPGVLSAAVLNVQGQTVFETALSSADDAHTLSMPVVPPGNYLLRLRTADEIKTMRLVVR